MNILDKVIGYFSPTEGLKRAHARRVMRSYQGAEANRLTNHKKPRNNSADQELLGPFGADSVRAWARSLVRDNAYAWNVLDTIVSNVVGSDGITPQSTFETAEGDDVEDVNDIRDAVWSDWCEVCDINGKLNFAEIQALCMREIVEAGEVLVKIVKTPGKTYRGITRPVSLALEVIEADRLSLERDTYKAGGIRNNNRIVRGVEIDELGKPVAYWIYKQHPNSPYVVGNQVPERIDAKDILHLFRMDRVGQTRGVSWFAPAMSWMRDLGVYVDNELQASAVASCFTAVIKTDSPAGRLLAPEGEDSVDNNDNSLEYLEPGLVARLKPGESIEAVNPGRPNAAAEPWIRLMLRGICAGTGTSYESVSKDFSNTSYSSSRTSKLDDRPRYRRWQNYIIAHFCYPIWDEFCNAAARDGVKGFPTATELLDERRKAAPVEWQTPEWEWVDPTSEQNAAKDSINTFMSTYQDELGARGRSWRTTFYQASKERKLRERLGLLTEAEQTAQMMAKQTEANAAPASGGESSSVNVAATALNGAQVTSLVDVITQVGTGAMPKETAKPVLQAAFPTFSPELISSIIDPIQPGSISADGVPSAAPTTDAAVSDSGVYMGLSTQQWNRNVKAIKKTQDALADGSMSESAAEVFLKSLGMPEEDRKTLIADAMDGKVDTPAQEVATDA
jgi:lambda family phage portal protein